MKEIADRPGPEPRTQNPEPESQPERHRKPTSWLKILSLGGPGSDYENEKARPASQPARWGAKKSEQNPFICIRKWLQGHLTPPLSLAAAQLQPQLQLHGI